MIRPLSIAAVAALTLTAAACSDADDDVVQAPAAPGEAAAPVSDTRADAAVTGAAVAMGMTREQLEDADLLAMDRTDLGDVETIVLDAAGQVTHLVIDLDGFDPDVTLPIGDVTSIRHGNDDVDLQTSLTVAQLRALPQWNPNAAR